VLRFPGVQLFGKKTTQIGFKNQQILTGESPIVPVTQNPWME